MKYRINIHRTNKDDWSVKAYVSITFDEQFKVTGVSIRENSRGNLFVAMPSYRTGAVNNNGKAVYKQYCNPMTQDFNKELSESILHAYREGLNGKEVQSGQDALSFYIKVKPLGEEVGNVDALVSVIFNRKFAVNGIRIVNGKNGRFIAMPSHKKGNAITGDEYVDVCHPVTKEFRDLLYENIFKALDHEKTEGNGELSFA